MIFSDFVGNLHHINHPLRNVCEVISQSAGSLHQVPAAVSEGGVVVKVTDSRIQGNGSDDIPGIKAPELRICIQFVEIRYTHGKISIGKELDTLRFIATSANHFTGASKQQLNLLLQTVTAASQNQPGRIKSILQRPALPSEIRHKHHLKIRVTAFHTGSIPHRNITSEDNRRLRRMPHDLTYIHVHIMSVVHIQFSIIRHSNTDKNQLRSCQSFRRLIADKRIKPGDPVFCSLSQHIPVDVAGTQYPNIILTTQKSSLGKRQMPRTNNRQSHIRTSNLW